MAGTIRTGRTIDASQWCAHCQGGRSVVNGHQAVCCKIQIEKDGRKKYRGSTGSQYLYGFDPPRYPLPAVHGTVCIRDFVVVLSGMDYHRNDTVFWWLD